MNGLKQYQLVLMYKCQACYQAMVLDSCVVLLFTSLLAGFWGLRGEWDRDG